jgi:hypothetical protein
MACEQRELRIHIDREAPMMPKINRLSGRFFAVLISLSLALCLPFVVPLYIVKVNGRRTARRLAQTESSPIRRRPEPFRVTREM